MKKTLISLAVALFCVCAQAEPYTFSSGHDSVTIDKDKACTVNAVLESVPSKFHHVLYEAIAYVDGRTFPACWFQEEEAAHLLYEDGDQGLIPLSRFKSAKDA